MTPISVVAQGGMTPLASPLGSSHRGIFGGSQVMQSPHLSLLRGSSSSLGCPLPSLLDNPRSSFSSAWGGFGDLVKKDEIVDEDEVRS